MKKKAYCEDCKFRVCTCYCETPTESPIKRNDTKFAICIEKNRNYNCKEFEKIKTLRDCLERFFRNYY